MITEVTIGLETPDGGEGEKGILKICLPMQGIDPGRLCKKQNC